MTTKKTGRNAPCPCGSGKKYKWCCSQPGGGQAARPRAAAGEIADAFQTAIAHHQDGRLPQAEVIYRQVLQMQPNHADALHLLGVIAAQTGKYEVAADLISRAINAKPSEPIYYNSMGNMLQAQDRPDEAIAYFGKALLLKADYADAHYNLGSLLKEQGKLDDAVSCFRRALLIRPDLAEAHNNLGAVLKDQGLLDEAIACCRQALLLKPDLVEAHSNLGAALKDQGRLEEAIACFHHALLIKPEFARAYNNLGTTYQPQGRLDEAAASFRKALALKPDYADAHSNLIFTLDLMMEVDSATLQAERRRWNEAHAAALSGSSAFPNNPEPERRLRIGYVSADFRKHSAAVGFGAMLVKFDPSGFEVFAYSNSAKEDAHTRLFQQSVSYWRKILGLSDDAAADLIRQDGIDILVDLSGHTAGNRLLVFARKPAPIQITAWGYSGGTGMKAMDVYFADPVLLPQEEKQFYAEEVRYLPSAFCAYFQEPFPEVNALPALSAKGVTFGSFNRLVKASAETFKVWAQVLLAIPDSTMVLKTAELDDAGTRDRVIGRFIQAGVDPGRITLLGRTSWHDHMVAFNRIDIALDPFPQGGGVTTLEGLMMGIPVVALRGTTFAGRGSASILTVLGLTDWIAQTQERYVAIAAQKAGGLAALAGLRQQLRPRFTASLLGDTEAYVRVAEQEYRTLWRAWCERQAARAIA